MAVSLKHAHTAVGVNAGTGEVRKQEWNAEHALTGAASTLLGFNGSGAAAEYPLATDADIRAGTADKVVASGRIYSSQAPVALSNVGTDVTPDFAAGRNFALTMGGHWTLQSPANQAAGQGGTVVVKQPASGGPYTLSYSADWKFAGGTPTLSATAGAVDTIAYLVEAGGTILAVLNKDHTEA
jgi:hypothetical protein